jgi:putative mycofactocin binding protein MftB
MFDPAVAWRHTPTVVVRPEPFGALLYDFSTRRLSFLKTPVLADVLTRLDGSASALDALAAAGVEPAQRPGYLAALGSLADAGTISRRDPETS